MKGMGEMASDGRTATTQLLHIQDTSSRVGAQHSHFYAANLQFMSSNPMTWLLFFHRQHNLVIAPRLQKVAPTPAHATT